MFWPGPSKKAQGLEKKNNLRDAETLFCFGEALRKGSREAQMAKQMMKTKQNEGKKLEMDRRKENRGGKYQMRRNIDVSIALFHRSALPACLCKTFPSASFSQQHILKQEHPLCSGGRSRERVKL